MATVCVPFLTASTDISMALKNTIAKPGEICKRQFDSFCQVEKTNGTHLRQGNIDCCLSILSHGIFSSAAKTVVCCFYRLLEYLNFCYKKISACRNCYMSVKQF